MSRIFFNASMLQFTSIVGAGIFALPYLFYKSNFYFASAGLLLLAIIMSWIDRFYADIVLRTQGDHQLPGYANLYLGRRFRFLAALNLFLLAVGALTAYVKLSLDSFHLFLPQFSLSQIFIAYFFLLFFIFHFSFLNSLFKLLPFIFVFLALLLAIMALQLSPQFDNPHPISLNFFGGLVFALSGFTIVPEVEEMLRSGRRHLLKPALLFGLITAVLVYFIFSYSVIRLTAPALSPNLISGAFRVSPILGKFLAIFVILATTAASLNFLIVLREFFYRDLRLDISTSKLLPFFFPLLGLVLSKLTFVEIISLTGSITIFVSALIICLIRLKLKSNFSVYLRIFLVMGTLLIGLISEFI